MKQTLAVAVMAKQPALGTVKTRLSSVLSAEHRLDLYTAMLQDKVEQVLALAGATAYVAFSPPEAAAEITAIVGDRPSLIAQRGADLGERLARVAADLFAAGHGGVVLVDSDTPNLPSEYLLEALAALDAGADVVIGPAWDGGYYLIGLARPAPALFAGIAWSTAGVLEQTVLAATRAGLGIHYLPSWFDVDTPSDLDRLARQLAATPAARPGYPWRTRAVLVALRLG